MYVKQITIVGDSGSEYTISVENGNVYCSCPAWWYGGGEDCKHIRHVRDSMSGASAVS